MKPTVTRALRKQSGEDTRRWADEEAIPVIDQARAALNQTSRERLTLRTSTASPAVLWISPEMPRDAAWVVDARVVGVGPLDHAIYTCRAVVRSIAGAVSSISLATTIVSESSVGFDAVFSVVGRTVQLTVTGVVPPMSWTAVVETVEGLL